jgi:cytochrome c5
MKAVFVLAVWLAGFPWLSARAADGKLIYAQACAMCHAQGVAGAPRLSDKLAWRPRIAAGKAALLTSVLKGKGAMPAKGGNASLSDADVNAAVEFILTEVR